MPTAKALKEDLGKRENEEPSRRSDGRCQESGQGRSQQRRTPSVDKCHSGAVAKNQS